MCEGVNQEKDRESLPALLQGEGIVGVSRLCLSPAFTGPVVCTLAYSDDEVRVHVVDARGFGDAPFQGTVIRPLRTLHRFGSLAPWKQLREAALTAPACSTLTCDGVSYRHALLDWQGGIEASWSNPSWSAHRKQCELVAAYRALIESTGILLEQGSLIRIRTGLLAGFNGRVEQLDRGKGRLRVVADLGGKAVSLDLGVRNIELLPEGARLGTGSRPAT